MCNFSLDGITTKLIPLDLNGIEDRIRWNTVSAEWKTIDDPNYTAQALNIAEYRKKKTQEILSGKRYIHGIAEISIMLQKSILLLFSYAADYVHNIIAT